MDVDNDIHMGHDGEPVENNKKKDIVAVVVVVVVAS
jgi:hypothetical protein